MLHDRVHAYGTKLEELLDVDWARSGREKIMALHAAASKPGHKQELQFWAKARKPAESLILKIEKKISNLGVPASGELLSLRAEECKLKRTTRSLNGESKRDPRVFSHHVLHLRPAVNLDWFCRCSRKLKAKLLLLPCQQPKMPMTLLMSC